VAVEEALVDVRLGNFTDVLSDLEPASVALVVADPPWNDLRAWSETGRLARRVLRPDGILLGYIGNRWAFEAIGLLSAHLTPVRLAFLPALHEDPFDAATKCVERGSFVAIMANGTFDPPGTWQNLVDSEIRGHRWHPFQQPLANVLHYVEAFSRPGDLVLDPFLGSGTTAVACLRLGRRFIGCDVDPATVLATRQRIESLAEMEIVDNP
jgi:DNA modification methylase